MSRRFLLVLVIAGGCLLLSTSAQATTPPNEPGIIDQWPFCSDWGCSPIYAIVHLPKPNPGPLPPWFPIRVRSPLSQPQSTGAPKDTLSSAATSGLRAGASLGGFMGSSGGGGQQRANAASVRRQLATVMRELGF